MSGESLRVMTDRAVSIVTVVASGGSGSSPSAARCSTSAKRCTDSNRCGTFETAPRPLRANMTGAEAPTTGSSDGIRSTGSSVEILGKSGLHLRRDLVDPHRIPGMVDADGHRCALPEAGDRGGLELETKEMHR